MFRVSTTCNWGALGALRQPRDDNSGVRVGQLITERNAEDLLFKSVAD
jgi:hypothetical protein